MLAITYLSSATTLLRSEALAELLAASRARNRELGVTGVLLYADGGFIQTLEGPAAVVEELFDRIGRDPRHRGVLEVWRESLGERTFSGWSMGFREIGATEAAAIPGFSHFLRSPSERPVEDERPFTPAPFYRVFRDGPRSTWARPSSDRDRYGRA